MKKSIIMLQCSINTKYSISTRALQSKYSQSYFIGMEKKADRDYNYFILAYSKSE